MAMIGTGTSMFDSKDTKQPVPNALNAEMNSTPVDAELESIELENLEASAQEAAEQEIFDEDFLYKIKPDSRRNERIIAFCLIYQADRFDYTVNLNGLMQNMRDAYSLEVEHNLFITTLVQGVMFSREELDEQIRPFLKNWKLERLGCCTRLILRMALWELLQEGAIPSIILNEAIELAKLFAEKDAYKFVNGILDEVAKLKHPTPGEEQA